MPGRRSEQEDPDLLPIENPEDWEVVARGRPATRLVTIISLRLDQPSAGLIQRAARMEGVTQSEFVRQAALRAAESVVRRQPVRVVTGVGQVEPVVFGTSVPRATTVSDASLVASTG